MRLIPLMIGFLLVGVAGIFAADGSAVAGLPSWVGTALQLLGVGGTGAASIFAVISLKVAKAESIIQALKNSIDKDMVLFSEIKSVVSASTVAVPSWNDAMTANAALFASIPVKGIEAKADIFNRLKITLPATPPAIVGKIESVAAKVEQVVDKAADIAAAIPQAATQTPISVSQP